MNIPGLDKPLQPLEVLVQRRLRAGRVAAPERPHGHGRACAFDVPVFGDTGFSNAERRRADLPRRERHSRCSTRRAKLPDPKLLWSPRVGFNWDVSGDQQTQVRGGTGVFTGRPAYVWISNQIGNTGVLTGFEQLDNTTARPFNPDPNRYKPANVDRRAGGELRAGPDGSGLQVPAALAHEHRRRSAPALGHRTGTAEFLYNQDVNGIYYINANLPAAQTPRSRARIAARDGRAATASTRTCHNAIVLKNQNVGRSWNLSGNAGARLRAAASRSAAPTATANPRTRSIRARSRSGPGTTTRTRATRTTPASATSFGSPGHRFVRAGVLQQRVLRLRRHDRSRSFWESAHRRQHQLRVRRRHERRRWHQQRPDLHPARHVRDELRDVHDRRPDVHGRRAGAGVRGLHRSRTITLQQAPRRVRGARRRVPADRAPGRPEHDAGPLPEHRAAGGTPSSSGSTS